jgi:phosphoribosylformylglycinamidine synthase subunit PurS
MKFRVSVNVMPRSEISDPQGQAVERTLPGIGFQGFTGVRIGKRISFVLEAADKAEAEASVGSACERLLANPVIEEFEFEVSPAEEAASSEGGG